MAVTHAALITAPGVVEVCRFTQRELAARQVRIDIHLCGVCVAEVKSFRDGKGHGPSLCGHEWVGTVREVGADVSSVAVGDRVVVAVPDPCGQCAECVSGRPEFCASVMQVARGQDEAAPPHGGFARSLTVADHRVIGVPPALSDEDAALVEPASIAFHGVSRAGLEAGSSVLVLGAGPIGLLSIQMAKAAGAGTTIAVEPERNRREVALEVGADIAVPDLDSATTALGDRDAASGADVVLECAGVGAAVQQAVDAVRPGGRAVLLGDPTTATVAPRLWLAKEVTVVASAGYSRGDIRAVMDLMAAGRVRAAPLHTQTIPLEDLGACLGAFADGSSEEIKVLVDPRLRVVEEETA